jgi:hypothetical protein
VWLFLVFNLQLLKEYFKAFELRYMREANGIHKPYGKGYIKIDLRNKLCA